MQRNKCSDGLFQKKKISLQMMWSIFNLSSLPGMIEIAFLILVNSGVCLATQPSCEFNHIPSLN